MQSYYHVSNYIVPSYSVPLMTNTRPLQTIIKHNAQGIQYAVVLETVHPIIQLRNSSGVVQIPS